jgi:hypothetical protein
MESMNCSVAKTTRKVNTNRKNWDVDAQANIKQVTEDINEKVKLHDYYDVEWRNEAILHSAVFGAKIMDKVQRQNNKRINGSIKTFLKNSMKIELMKVAIARIYKEKHIPIPVIQENLGYDRKTGLYSGNIDYIIENLKNTSEDNDNIISWCREAFNDEINEKTGISYSNEFFNSVFTNGKLKHIKFNKDDNFGEYTLEQALDVNEDSTISDSENGDNPVDSDTDDSIAAFEHSGEHKDFTIGIDENIKTYFNTLNKLKSSESTTDKKGNKVWQLDKENKYGIVNTMNDRECISVLLHQGDFVDDVTMIDSIKRIARQCAGFEAFMKFAEDLENNADFRYKVYNNFAKIIMRKLETVVEDGNGKPNLANKRSNSTTALAFEFRNTIKSTAISVNNYEIADEYDKLNKKITIGKNNTEEENNKIKDLLNRLDTNRNDEDVLQIIGDLTSMLQNYYPTIDKFAIANYLYNAQNNKGEIDVVANLSNLKNILHRTINASKNTSINYNSLQYDIATEKNKAKRYALYNTDYVDNSNNQEAQALAELLAPYSAVRVDLNSRNTEGKLSSDVLNNNFLTGFINTLQSSLNKKFKDEEGNVTYAKDCPLEHYKEFKFKSNQYNFSNILVEKIENGKVINRGLFRKENGEYVPTEYATDLLRVSKFNGATSFDNGKNTLYSKMSKADYITTAVINFFNTEGNIKGTPMANYFMRTPSDSSTQYVITAPRYAITQSGNNALRTSDNKINKNHPIFIQLKNAFLQELIDMGTAINTIFVTDKDGCVTRIEKDGKHLLQFKEGFENKPTSRLYKKYHYNGEVVKNFGKENEKLTGNVFKSNRFVIVKEDGTEVNYGQEFIDKFVDFLYGGAINENGNESLKFIKDGDKIVDINLSAQSENFRNAIDDMISNFIADYTKETINRVQSSKQFIKSSLSSLIGEDKDNKEFNRKISEFILNTHLMYINFDDLFEGNSKFYGSAQDFLKRAKEVQGSGVPYGIVNYNNIFSITRKTEKKGALLNDKTIINKIGDIKQYDSFRAVTIVNTVRTPRECSYKKSDGSGEDGVLVKALSANFAKQNGRKRPNAKDLERSRKMMEGFADAKVNDAQSYITFEEWVRRIAARGQLMKHLPLIEKIQKGENLTDNEMDAFVQVQKNFYYDQYYDHQTGIIVPRQIKNAEFVLVPQFIKGTQLEQVYNLMKENDIDQLNTEETSKAGKHNVLTLWDNDGNLIDKNIKDFKAKVNGAAEYFNYNYLYTQQETPQHVNAENKAGIQIMKKIVDNIPVGHKLYSVKERFMNLYSANIQASFNDTMTELNVETDENGYPVLDDNGQIKGLDYNKLYDLFKEEAERLGMDSNLSDYFTLEDDVFKGIKQPLMPNFFGNVSNRVESVAQALFNSRITRQTLPGFHGAQVTQIGFKKENIQKSDALHYHSKIDENGKEVYAPYIEVMLPKANFGLSAYDDAKALEMLQEAEADELIGYRIPTEGKQSVAIMKVVGFTNDAQGSTIIVPDGWVPQTGSDFDIDSIYGIQYHSYIGKDGKLHKSSYIGDKLQLYKNYIFSKLTKEELETIKDNSTITEEDIKDGISTSDIKSEFIADLNHYAKIHNLKSYEEFSKTDIDLLNSKEARDNEILRCMMTILSDESSMEENLGRSKFDAISNEDENNLGAIQKMMNPIERSRRKKRSPYNFLDQADYQDDAMSGAKLKGFSVTRDNLCSVCNTVRPIISTDVYTMLYDATKYDIKELENSFGKNNVNLSKDKKYIQVRHKTFGWTLTNKNVVGEILTSYSSQTTAHILDAIKEGAAPNVNDLTFAVYKTFVDIGSDYDTAIGFMAQPAVSRIVEAYNKNKSIFTDFNTNPLQQAIRELASNIGIVVKDKKGKGISITKLIKEINNNEELKKAFKEIFGVNLNIEKISGNKITFEDFALPAYLLKDRIDKTGIFASSPVENNTDEISGKTLQHAFDLGILLKYSQYATFSQRIGDIARVMNPDKFGAKKNIFETNKVFDDIKELIDKGEIPLKVRDENKNVISILEAVYPGIGNGTVDEFMRSNSEIKSMYPPLYTFLKYATAPSIIINRTLFETQTDEFVNKVNEIERVLGFDSRITEKLYTDFQKYILGEIYSEIPFIKYPVIFDKETNRFTVDISVTKEDEISRIYGFGASSDINFEPQNLYNPTKTDIETWRKLSPVQKVLWIQQNAKNPGIFGLFKVDLRNSNRNGAQTLEFVEDSVGIEEAYSMFNNAFYSENPLIRYAAADLIKYSFIVEGYAMSQHAVNKVIRNTALRQSLEEGGTGIVNYMRESVKNIESDINIDYIIENYVKSHNIPGLPKLNLNDISTVAMVDENNKETYYELKDGQRIEKERPTPTGVLIVQLNDDNISKLNEHNILRMDEDNYDYCSYFKTTGKKSKVYKFIIKDDVGYIYPLNKLQANEHSEWSTNLDNNKEPSAKYFENIIYGVIDTSRRAEFMSPISYKISKNKNIDVNELKDNTVNKINSVANEILKGNVYYLWSNELATKLPKYGDMTISTINGIEYDIIHVNVLKTQAKYLGENSDVHIQSKDVAYNDLLNNKEYGLKAMGFKKPSTDVFMVKMHKKAEAIVTNEELNSDTLEDLGALSVEAVFANAKTGDKIAKTASDMLLGRNYNKKEDIPVNTADSLFVISNYLTRVVDKINDQLNHFETEDGTSYSVTDPKVIDYIRNNPEARRRYLKLLLDARKIKKQFEAYSAFDTTSTDPELKKYLDNIKDKVVKLDEALTSNGLELFAKDYLKKISTNPLVQGDIITLLDGFYGSGVIEAMINDTQEMPNPLVQIITKEVMADIRAKEMEADERIAELEKTIETIKKEAKAAGLDVSWDNIVDEFGRLIQPFKQSFIDDYRTLRQAVDNIKNERTSDGKIDYEALNKAQLELDKWLNDNVELALKGDEVNDLGLPIKSFYTKKIELEQELINKAPKVFAKYKELKDLRRNIKKRLDSSVGNADIEKELKDIDLELKDLTSSSTFDAATNTFILKKDKEKENAELLNHYKKKIKELYEEYFDKEENSGFKEELEENLRIVKEAERRDKNGIIQASKYELKFNDRYQRAIEWLRKNAIFNPDPNTYQRVNEAFKVLGSGKNVSVTRKLATLLAKASGAYDVKGRIDGTKLNQEQQRNLTAAQQKEYNDRANADAISISLIHNAGDNEEVYTKEFYKLLSKEGYSKSIEYKNIVKNINSILAKYYSGKNINFVNMTNDELNKLANLYRELREIRKDIEFTWKGKYSKLHSELIEYKINQDNFDIAKNAAELANVDMNLWYAVNTELIKDESGKEIRIPNKLIYGKPVPTEEARNKKNLKTGKSIYVDEDKTAAFKVIKGYMISEPSEYYHEEYARRKKEGVDEDGRTFDKWYKDNHVYDPYSRTMVPSKIWMVSRLNDNNEGTWEAGFEQTHSVPKEKYKNPNHKDGISLGINYKDNNGKYKNDVKQNEYEKKLQNEINKLLISLAKVESAKRFFESGYMPIMSKEAEHDYRFYLKEAAKGIGWIEDTNRGKDLDDDINYANDYIPDMPMTSMIKDKKNRRVIPEKPIFNEGDDVNEYNKKLEEYEKIKKEIKDEEDKYHKEQLNRDWESVLKRFIKEAAHYNAVQDNRLMLYYGQEILKNQLVYDTNLGRSDLKVNKRKSTASKTVYQTRSSKREYDQYTNWMRRLLFNQWKYDNPRWTRLANLAQSFTSANFMMMNVRGGIANVTLGETQIMAEAFAKEYFGTKDYLKGKTIWMSNITDYISNMYSDKSSSVAGALIKFMNVVDFDNISGVVEADLDPAVWLTRARDFMFSPQTMGEHFMQNGAMFSIMLSHRLYKNTNPELNGKTEYIVKGRAEVIRDAHEDALMKILENDTKLKNEFLEFRKSQLSDDNTKKEYAWYRRDMTNEFLKKLDNDKQKEFIKLRKQFEKEALKEFETMPDIMSQFKLGDNGKLAFADGSILSNLNNNKENNSEVNDAYKILGALKGRIISVNKKIHGVYDRMGSAQIEKYWWGALAMQYHKHIYPGFMKRYRRHGYYNEERGTIEKGCYNALIDFLSIPIRKYRQDMNDEELRGMEGIQNLFKNISDFCLNIKTNWQLLPDYERKNIRRNLGDVIGVLGAVAIAIGLRALGDDDDEDGIIYNLALYEADRLASESFQFNPFGAASEAKKLWSNPVAVQSIVNDVLSSMGTMAQILIEGEDYDPYYHSGKYAGEHKLKVYIERRIPVWRGINAILNIGDDNHYYKLGDNMISIIPVKDIATWIKE